MKKLQILLCACAIGLLLSACATATDVVPARSAQTPPPVNLGTAQLGARGCHPPSPVAQSDLGGWEARGTTSGSDTTQVWALLMPTGSLPVRAHESVKIVWKMTGSGSLRLVGIGPDGMSLAPMAGPQQHGSSNWARPGDEWGSQFLFPTAGCWDLHATRGEASGDIWLEVR